MSTPSTSAPARAAGTAVVPSPQPRSSTSRPFVTPIRSTRCLAAVAHARRDAGEVALLPQCLVRVHLISPVECRRAMVVATGSAVGLSQDQHPRDGMRPGCEAPEVDVQGSASALQARLQDCEAWTAELEIRVLGSIELVRDGQSVPIGGPKPRLRPRAPGRPSRRGRVDRAALRGALGRRSARRSPAPSSRATLSRLRKLLRPEADIVARPPGYVLQVADGAVDAERFERLCTTAKAVTDPAQRADAAPSRAGVLAGVGVRGVRRARLGRLARRCGSTSCGPTPERTCSRPGSRCGEHAALVGELEALVADSPLRERLWQQLIIALYRSGRSAEALRRAAALRTVLREELGPRAVAGAPRARGPGPRRRPDAARRAALPSRRTTPRRLPAETTQLVGRADELGAARRPTAATTGC